MPKGLDQVISMVCYYVAPALLGLLFSISLKLQPSLKVRVVLITISTTLPLYAAETLFHFTEPGRTVWVPRTNEEMRKFIAVAKRFGVECDSRNSRQVLSDLHANAVDAVRS
jgi:hypothetical protein